MAAAAVAVAAAAVAEAAVAAAEAVVAVAVAVEDVDEQLYSSRVPGARARQPVCARRRWRRPPQLRGFPTPEAAADA